MSTPSRQWECSYGVSRSPSLLWESESLDNQQSTALAPSNGCVNMPESFMARQVISGGWEDGIPKPSVGIQQQPSLSTFLSTFDKMIHNCND
jgi:hypothetical protein